jgi:hypothetical protein
MKKIVLLAILAGLMYGAVSVLQSVYFCLFELQQAVAAGDLEEVKKRADLEALSRNIVDFQEAQLKVLARQKGGELGEGLFSGLAQVLRKPVEKEILPKTIAKLESEIAGGRLLEDMEPFQLSPGLLAIGGVEAQGADRVVHVDGTCHGEPATVSIHFSPARNERWGGLLSTYKATGLEQDSIIRLVESCYKGQEKSPK